MYPFVDYTWNPIRGECPFHCAYCYVPDTRAKRYYQGRPQLIEKEFKTNMGCGNAIFVGSMIDMWHWRIPSQLIGAILIHCNRYNCNQYIFQTKFPFRYDRFRGWFLPNTLLGTTIETNRPNEYSSMLKERIDQFLCVKWQHKFVSIEPIMDFDVDDFCAIIKKTNPEFVVIGADSKKHNLPKPPTEKIDKLICRLNEFTKVILKKNLRRLYDK